MKIAFTGSRILTTSQEWEVETFLHTLPKCHWVVGDAPGLDALVLEVAKCRKIPYTVFDVQGNERWHFAERTKTMVKSLTPQDKLIAFPNKKCPDICYPSGNVTGQGSGTWLAAAYATHRQIPVEIFPLYKNHTLPDWLLPQPQQLILSQQLTLF